MTEDVKVSILVAAGVLGCVIVSLVSWVMALYDALSIHKEVNRMLNENIERHKSDKDAAIKALVEVAKERDAAREKLRAIAEVLKDGERTDT